MSGVQTVENIEAAALRFFVQQRTRAKPSNYGRLGRSFNSRGAISASLAGG